MVQISSAITSVTEASANTNSRLLIDIWNRNPFHSSCCPEFCFTATDFDSTINAILQISIEVDAHIETGGGETEFWTAGTVKWVPIPDVDKQPAVGIRGGFSYARDSGADLYHLLIAPIISKKADTRYGEMIPFIALPISIPVIDTKVNNTTGTQLAIGAEWFYADVNYGLELDLNLGRSFSAISAFISFPFDSATGYKK